MQQSNTSGKKNHKQILEETLVGQVVSQNPIEQLEEDEENFDRIELAKNDQDQQYNNLLKDMNNSSGIQGPNKGAIVAKTDLSQLPKYKGKKVSRKDMLEGDYYAQKEDGDEDELSYDSGDIENDEQINEMDDGDNNEDQENDSEDNEAPIKQFIKSKKANDQGFSVSTNEKQNKKKDLKKPLQFDINKKLEEIEEEDRLTMPSHQADIAAEQKKSQHLLNQLSFLKELAMLRFMMQKSLESVKKLPLPSDLDYFLKSQSSQASTQQSKQENYDATINKKRRYSELLVLQNIDDLIAIRQNYLQRANCPLYEKSTSTKQDKRSGFGIINKLAQQIQVENISEDQYCLGDEGKELSINTFELYKHFNTNLVSPVQPWIEECIVKWSQKTNILANNLKKSGLQTLMQTPIGQTQKAMQSYDKLLQKSQLKRSSFRILGQDQLNLQEDSCPEIFDDADLYHEMLKEYINELELNDGSTVTDSEGLLINSTRMYLLERKLKQQERKQKTIDRRASKNRKIRYEVHPKLLNFMNPQENTYLLEGRNEIVQCLIGKEYQENQENEKQKESNSPTKKLTTVLLSSDGLNDQQKLQSIGTSKINKNSITKKKLNKKLKKIKMEKNLNNYDDGENIELI